MLICYQVFELTTSQCLVSKDDILYLQVGVPFLVV